MDLTCYGRQAETINQYMSKGRPLLVEGRLRYQNWTNKEGQKRNKLDVVVENFTFLGGAPGGGGRPEERAAAPSGDEPPPPADLPPGDNPEIPF